MMLKMKLLSTILLIMMACKCLAIPADPTPRKIQQPDGTFVTLRMQGDEYLNYTTTVDGFTVVKDGRGFWVYACKQDDGSMAATSMVAHDETDRTADERTFLSSMPKGLVPKMDSCMAEMRQNERVWRAKVLEKRRAARYDYSKFRGLIILVEFNDRSFTYGEEMNSIMNDIANKENYQGDSRTNLVDEEKGYNARFVGSVRDYFRDNSSGLFQPEFDVVGPVKIDRSQYFANQTSKGHILANEAVAAADPLVDFSQYDGDGDGVVDIVYFVFAGYSSQHAGNDSRLIWPYASAFGNDVIKDGVKLRRFACSTEMMMNEELHALDGIGTICHEFAHVLGLPDLYDTDGEGSGGLAPDPGAWSLMGSGGNNGYRRVPSNLTLYERFLLGFIQDVPKLTKTGKYSIHEVSTNEGFRIESPVEGEFFVIENRQLTGWDTYLPGHGMLVFRVDASASSGWENGRVNQNPNHMCYELLFAGGYQGVSSPYDPFPGQGNVTMLTNTTSPANLRTWEGKECEFSLAHIAETDGVISFDLVDASTFGEIIMPESQDMYEGICYHLEPTIYMSTTSYRKNWKSDNPNVASVDKQGNVTAVAEGTAHITLTIGNFSATCTVTVVPANVVPNIESLLNYPAKTEQVLQLNNAQVFFVQKSNGRDWLFVRDGTRSIELINFNIDAEPGDVLNGRLYGRYNEGTQWMMMYPLDDIYNEGSIQITHGPMPEPDVVTVDNLNSVHVMDYITMKGVSLGYRPYNGNSRLWILAGERNVRLSWGWLALDFALTIPSEEEVEGKLYDLEMVVNYFNNPGYTDEFMVVAPFTLSESTGIDQPDAPLPQREGLYNLQGQRINMPTSSAVLPKGVYIENGKKMIIH